MEAQNDYSIDESAFVQSLVKGDPAAWRDFQLRYASRIERAILSVTSQFRSVVSADDVKEIYAMVCLRLLDNDKRRLRSFDPTRGHSLSGWLGMVAVQATYDYLRRRRRQLAFDLHARRELEAAATGCDPFEECWAQERSRVAKSLLAKLGSRDREFLQLYIQDRLPDEIAAAMGINVTTVYTKKHKISGHLSRLAAGQDLAA